jgi:hypothetical protein
MPVSLFKRARGGTEQIDIQEAYNIWNWLRIRYNSLETIQLYQNFVHDRDFSLLLDRLLKDVKKNMSTMEEEGAKFLIPVPDRPPLEIKFDASINQITDKLIYRKIFADMIAELFTISRSVRSSTTNDRLRKIFIDDMLTHLRNFELLFKYSKAKAWQQFPPAYKTASPSTTEQLSLTEAFHLWDLLSQRYDQLQLTTFYLEIVHDPDFKMILQQGLKSLNEQVSQLEQKALSFAVIFPDRPPASMKVSIDPEVLTDSFIYSNIFTGMVEAIDLHMRSVIETITNDGLRDYFIELLKNEIKMFNSFLKYGKAKGWTKVIPIYGEPVG